MTVWLDRRLILSIHDIQLAEHGGDSGIRDDGLLESALARPRNHAGYNDPDIAELGAFYALGISRNHPFIDGNKRTAWSALVLFLSLNGMHFEPPDVEAAMTMLQLAAGEMSDAAFIAWVRSHACPRG